ncbi:MAG TPA: protein translocase subunit SecD [Gammaproteobacteria bacterium]|jgi:preprotein translocase subunit SecD|nr:protein translocase subunit SecD [Chromatiales bacterium]MCP4926970.1 protein translocase subunit SecD [Gammaproteobacteria bacterium]HJP39056.1 protein translocase subunit SecD [Gammaproteobacteria bacterium]
MNYFSAWKNLLIFAVVAIGVFIALPNIFGEDPALQVSRDSGSVMTELEYSQISLALDEAKISYSRIYEQDGRAMILFGTVDDQLRASDLLHENLGKAYVIALTLAPRTPDWMRAIGLKPMSLGLDLRGGVHFLFEVDIDGAVEQRLKQYESDFDKLLRKNRIKRKTRLVKDAVRITLGDASDADRAEDLLRDADADIDLSRRTESGSVIIVARMTEDQVKQRRDFAIQQNTVTLRNRVNELGVAEPLVQRQGLDRIVVQLPGVQDPAQAERILGATATLEFRLVCDGENALEAERRGRAPIGCELYSDRVGNPVLLKRRTIVSGDQLVDATSGFSQGSPAVFVKLDSKGSREMLETTKSNLQKPMAVVFVEQKRDLVERNGEMVEVNREEKEVINVATIQGVFSSNFQITGLDVLEARDLSLLLRAGALAAPIFKVEGRMIGPSLGQDNIDKGIRAIVIGLALVAVFMVIYYRSFGFVADLALMTNLVLVVALLSMLQASLTLPGIAGIVLTVGMAVDSNVLIFERIREELRNGNSPQASIHAGYQKALSTIADANITTLIAAIVLFVFGTGPIKGFAVTLSLGIVTSMFTAIIGTRAIINLVYGKRNLERLSI